MKFMFKKQVGFFLAVILLVLLLSGCATRSLWEYNNEIVVSDKNLAKVDQIYAAVDKKSASNSTDYVNIFVRYAIPYRLEESDRTRSNKILFPKNPHGYLIISDQVTNYLDYDYFARSYYGEQYQDTSKYRELFQSTYAFIKELNANRFYIVKAYGPFHEQIELNFRFRSQPHTKPAVGYLLPSETIPPFASMGLPYERAHDGNQPSYYNLCCMNGTVTYADKIDLSEFTPMFPEELSPLETNFYLLKGEKKYKYPLFVRLIGAPFTLAIDAVTSPIQLFLYLTAPHR